MPYRIFHSKNGFFVADGNKRFSNHPLTKEMAIQQREAIAINEAKKKKKPVGYYFSK